MIINSDNITALKNYPDNYFDSIVTDPPYGLGKEPDAIEVMTAWATTGYHEIKGTGFMGKEWDAFVPQPLFWKEVFRVLKPGGHCLAFYGTRTYDWGVMAMRFAGFEVRDCIQWLYGSGFPKSHNISKAVDKMYGAEREVVGKKITGTMNNKGGASVNKEGWDGGQKEVFVTAPSTVEAKQWDGWGSALKPANEPIVLARKPLEKGLSIAENVLKYGTGGINIDGCRVNFKDDADLKESTQKNQHADFGTKPMTNNNTYGDWSMVQPKNYQPTGRFPANIILTHHPQCECKQNEEVEDWNCHPDCPIKILDEQSGVLKSGGGDKATKGKELKNYGIYGKYTPTETKSYQSDKGGASRFFYVAKASKSERNNGLENNFHPTVKPIKLMQYLVRLITPPNGIVLDPFCGSGTTGVACKLEGFNFIGIEQDAEYCKIAEARIKSMKKDLTLF